ncbi:hypothetical protein Dimus_008650 [Dionaea muscipula]
MASMSICISSAKAFARGPKTQNPQRKPSRKSPRQNPPRHLEFKTKPISITNPSSSSPSIPIEPITYTRLPPRDQEPTTSSSISSAPSFHEIKLSDSLPQFIGTSGKKLNVIESDSNVSSGKVDVLDEKSELDSDPSYGVYGGDLDAHEGCSDYEGQFDDFVGEFVGFSAGESGEVGAEDGERKEKEKGVPAIMRCFDRAKIYVKAGDGGNGVVAFRREKFVPFGGPSGGDGGRGGNVYVEVDGSMNSLLPFRNKIHFRAGRGAHGQGSNQDGSNGEDVVVKVPPGTVIREVGDDGVVGKLLLELLHPGQRALLLHGGRGGRGNASFKSGTNKAPKIAENGEEGPETWLELELKLVADVGIVGAPNAGKSTLLSVISAARPTIANYPFTTLLPNLGVFSFDYDSTMVLADLPGLLEGAHRGFGLGHEFLRHAERCTVLIHVVDGSSEQPEYEFDAIRLELELFNPELAEKPYLVAYNKMDLPEATKGWEVFKRRLQAKGIEPFCMSALKREGTHEVVCAAYELVRKSKEVDKSEEGQPFP